LTEKIGSGATPRGGESVYRRKGVALIRSQNVLDNSMRTTDIARISDEAAESLKSVAVAERDVLLNITGDSVARCSIVDPAVLPARVNQHVAIIRPGKSLDSRFLQKVLVNPSFKQHLLTIATGGGTRSALTKAQISDLEIPLPPLNDQQAIAEVLGALDDKVAANIALVTTARHLALAMLPSVAVTAPLGTLVVHRRKQADPATMSDALVEHFSLPAFDAGKGPEIVEPSTIKSGKFLVDSPALLVSKLNPRTPRVWPVTGKHSHRMVASTEFLVLEPTAYDPWVMWALLAQPSFGAALEAKVAGTSGSHQRVRPDEVLATAVTDPRALPQRLIADLGAVLAPIEPLAEENRILAATRDALLPPLMSGKLRVGEAEKLVSEAGA
jgi:type I restriction enzyme, S subunit